MQDILYDPQTSGGLLIAVDGKEEEDLLRQLGCVVPCAARIGYVTEREDAGIILEG